MTRRPKDDDILLAAEWLDENEGDPDEREPMQRVAAWLRAEVDRRNETRSVRKIARASGVSEARARAFLRQRLGRRSRRRKERS